MIRKAYLRFDCPNCDRPGNRRRGRRWTTVCGTVEIEFVLRKLDRNSVIRRDSSLLIFHVNIYRMKCMECHSL